MGIKIEQTKYEPIPAGVYMAQVGNVEQAEGQFGSQLKIRFDLLDPDFSDRSLTGWTSCKLSPKAKLWAWAKAAIFGGRAIPDDYTFDSDDLLDKRVQIVVSTERGSDGETYNKVKDVLPVRAALPTRRAQPAPDAQPPAMQPRATVAQTSHAEPPGWPELSDDDLADPGPTDEDLA